MQKSEPHCEDSAWDAQIGRDVHAGLLDVLVEQAMQAYQSGRTTELDRRQLSRLCHAELDEDEALRDE